MNALLNERLPSSCKHEHLKWVMTDKHIWLKKILIVDLRPKTRLCFYDIILMILCKKRFIESFVVYSSVLTLWKFKVMKF